MSKVSAKVASQMLAEARADVVQADQKASILFAALGIGYGAVLGGILSSGWEPTKLPIGGVVLWWIGVVTAAGAIAASALAIWPRYTVKNDEGAVTYWAHAAAFGTWQALVEALDEQDPDDVDRDGHQLWRLSRVVLNKYRFVRLSIVLAGGAAVVLALSTLVPR